MIKLIVNIFRDNIYIPFNLLKDTDMPNWCDNYLTLTGPAEATNKFIADNVFIDEDGEVGTFRFNQLVPIPDDKEEDADWATENWGTKWDLTSNEGIVWNHIDDTHVGITFFTAWGPPDVWLKTVAPMYPEITFTLDYVEQGMFLCGKIIAYGEFFNNEDQSNYFNELSELFLLTLKHFAQDNDDREDILSKTEDVISNTKYAYLYDAVGEGYFYNEIEEVFERD
jgi:hypothetical protein